MGLHFSYPAEAFLMLEHLRPSLRISPFSPRDMNVGKGEGVACLKPEFWLDKGQDILFTNSGRDALATILDDIGLTELDNVLIVTTSQGSYISSCVTNVIGSRCGWSRKINDKTRAVLVIHEFGFPCAVPEEFLNSDLPIIEDCAYAIGSRVFGASVGILGDYAIYSLPKYFPLPFGGIAVSRRLMRPMRASLQISQKGVEFIKTHLVKMVVQCDEWNIIRRSNWSFFDNKLDSLGMKSYFELQDNISPGVYVLKLPERYQAIGAKLKTLCVNAGIEATEYYGQGGFYFPVHQFLTDFEKELICYQFKKGVEG